MEFGVGLRACGSIGAKALPLQKNSGTEIYRVKLHAIVSTDCEQPASRKEWSDFEGIYKNALTIFLTATVCPK